MTKNYPFVSSTGATNGETLHVDETGGDLARVSSYISGSTQRLPPPDPETSSLAFHSAQIPALRTAFL